MLSFGYNLKSTSHDVVVDLINEILHALDAVGRGQIGDEHLSHLQQGTQLKG